MYELADRDFWYRRTPYSPAEASLMTSLSDVIETLTRENGRAIRPFICLFPPIPVLRTVAALAGGRPLRILEIGGGAAAISAPI
jgi:hypothetical protein